MTSFNEPIQFTMEFCDKKNPFLDMDVDGLYHNPTDTQRSPYSSSHPKHCLTNIPFVMGRRIYTIVKKNSLKNEHLRELKVNFKTFGYPEKVVEIGIQKALKIPQMKLRQPKTI